MAFLSNYRLVTAWLITAGMLTAGRSEEVPARKDSDDQTPTVREVEITTVPGRLMFSPRTITVLPGERLRLKVKNAGALTHNFVICSEGESNWKEVANFVIDLGESAKARAFNPGPPLVTHGTPLLAPGEEAILDWTAPKRTGAYPFLSSVPGHAPLMRGEIFVSPERGGLSDIRYHYYEGQWEKIPDFSKLKSIESGKLEGSQIDFGAIGILHERQRERKPGVMAGVVITADAQLLLMGSYHFALRSHSNSMLSLSDVITVSGDGVAKTRLKTAESVDDGSYGLVLEVIGEGKLETPGAAWHGPAGTEILSVGDLGNLASWSDYVLTPGEEEPLAVTVPMPDASALALAVAIPYEINYCFDPETHNVRYAWSGGFLDARPTDAAATGRPGGNCKPLGKVLPLGAGSEFPLRIGNLAEPAPEVTYLGHTSGNAEEDPELMFRVGKYTVAQQVSLHGETDEHPEIAYTFRIDPAPDPGVPIVFSADPAHVNVTAPAGFARDGVAVWTFPANEQSVTVRLQSKKTK